MKHAFLAPFLAILGVQFGFGDQVASTSFRGLNNNQDGVIIEPDQAQDLLNVDVTPGGKSVKKRPGHDLFKALGTGQGLHGGHHAFNSTGNDYQLWGSSRSLYGIVNDATPVQLVSSATLNATWDCTDTQANSYCVNSNRDAYIRTDGTTMSWYTSPLGTMVESTPDRVVVAGVAGSRSTLYVSQSNTFTNFVTGVNPTDAFTEVIASPGSGLTHIRWGCGKLLWWKDSSFGYLDFDDQYTALVKTVSDSIGTFDNTSAIDPGGQIWFRGQDGHTWKYDCSILTKESVDITPSVSVSGRRTSKSWAQTTQADWAAGYSVLTDTTSVPGSVVMISSSDGFSSLAAWRTSASTCPWTASGGYAYPTSNPENRHCALSLSNAISPAIPNHFALGYDFKFPTSGTNNGITVAFVTSSGNGYCLDVGGGVSGSIVSGAFSSNLCGSNLVAAASITDTNNHYAELVYSSTGYARVYLDGVLKGTYQDTTYSGMDRATIVHQCTNSSCSSVPKIDYFFVRPSTAQYFSAVNSAPSLSSWGLFSVSDQMYSSLLTMYIRSSTSSFTVSSSTPTWVYQLKNFDVVASTGTYFQVRADFDEGYYYDSSPPTLLDDFTVNWFEGNAADQAYMLYFDNAIWQSVAISSSTNNYIFKYDLINDGWTQYNFGAGGMLVQNNRLYFGSPLAGNILKYGVGTSDNGTAINAYWKSKTFTGADPFLQNSLTNIDTFAKKDQGTTLTSTYTLDTSTSTSYSISLSTAASIIQNRKLLPSGKLGYGFAVQYGDTSASSAWELFGYRLGYKQNPYRPSE